MSMRISQCFSALVASGQGQKCNEFKGLLHGNLITTDPESGLPLSILFKNGKRDFPKQHKEVCKQVAAIMNFVSSDVDEYFFGEDLKKDNSNGKSVS
jgi:hypothetical protein